MSEDMMVAFPPDDIDDMGPLADEKPRPKVAERNPMARQRYDAGLCARGCDRPRREDGAYCIGPCPRAGARLDYETYTGKAPRGLTARETNQRFFRGKGR